MIENFLAALRAATAETLERAADDQLINGWGRDEYENEETGARCLYGSLAAGLGRPARYIQWAAIEEFSVWAWADALASVVAGGAFYPAIWNDDMHKKLAASDPLWLRDRMLETAKGLRAVGHE